MTRLLALIALSTLSVLVWALPREVRWPWRIALVLAGLLL